jgi:hypothetical protein
MKQMTLEIDDAIFHSAESKARQAGTSLPAVVLSFLRQFSAGGGSEFERLEMREESLRQQLQRRGAAFAGGDRLTRDELHERHAIS